MTFVSSPALIRRKPWKRCRGQGDINGADRPWRIDKGRARDHRVAVPPFGIRRPGLRRLAHRPASGRVSAAPRADRTAGRRIGLQRSVGPRHDQHRSGDPQWSASTMTTIHKSAEDLRVTPNLVDYDDTRATFDWSAVPNPCAGMPAGGCNIAYAAV